VICGSSGIANWPSRRGRLDPALGAAVRKPQFRERDRNGWTVQRGPDRAEVAASTTSFGRTRTSVSRSQPSELTLQRVDLCKVAAGVVVAASLAASESEAPARVSVTGAVSAQVDDRREVLPLLQRGGRNAVAGEDARDRAIQQRGGHLHSMSGHHTCVERVEPARVRVVPGPWAVLKRDDLTMRYKASIESMTVLRGCLHSIRRTDTFSSYRRFLGTAQQRAGGGDLARLNKVGHQRQVRTAHHHKVGAAHGVLDSRGRSPGCNILEHRGSDRPLIPRGRGTDDDQSRQHSGAVDLR
jgi:hypothetical protein